jgi:signal transduction histidine kinase
MAPSGLGTYVGCVPKNIWQPPWKALPRQLYQTGSIPLGMLVPGLLALCAGLHAVEAIPVVLLAFFASVPLLSSLHRHRLVATRGIELPSQRITGNWLTSKIYWRQVGYHLFVAPVLALAGIAAFVVWLAGLAYSLVYVYAWGLSSLGDSNFLHNEQFHVVSGLPVDLWLTLAGLGTMILAAPVATTAVGAADAWATQELLGRSRTKVLEQRVDQLTQTRAGVIDAADAERRRLERDLHDGTQQRLVSLAMMLGMARSHPADAPAQEVIEAAHEEAKAALAELRNLVRGMHPVVLEDRGLDAALSGIAARVPISVRLTVDVPRRPHPTIEAVAYFVISESLTNITKHAQASQAEVYVHRAGDRLHIIVSDDGVGGAEANRGTGLAGLAKRAGAVDGSFEISSPAGGPTLVTVDLPCVR